MTDTFWSSHIDDALYDLGWATPAGVTDQWPVLLRVLAALASQAPFFGTVSGKLRVANGEPDEWPVDTNSAALRERLASVSAVPEPIELTLSCEPLLWLPDDHVNVIDYDDSDLFSFGHATLSPEANEPDGVLGMRPWRLRKARVPLLSLEGSFGAAPFTTSMGLQVRSECDLWRSMRLDGEPNTPHGEANARMLARSIEEIAAATNARIRRQPSTDPQPAAIERA